MVARGDARASRTARRKIFKRLSTHLSYKAASGSWGVDESEDLILASRTHRHLSRVYQKVTRARWGTTAKHNRMHVQIIFRSAPAWPDNYSSLNHNFRSPIS